MRSIFNYVEYQEIRRRIEVLESGAERRWGEMDIAQMLAHCDMGLKQALGKIAFVDKSNFIFRTLVKSMVLRTVKKGDIGKNQRTFPLFLITDERNFDSEKKALLKNLDEFYQKGNQMEIGRHPYFGKFRREQWGGLQYVHFDHHLRQFSA